MSTLRQAAEAVLSHYEPRLKHAHLRTETDVLVVQLARAALDAPDLADELATALRRLYWNPRATTAIDLAAAGSVPVTGV